MKNALAVRIVVAGLVLAACSDHDERKRSEVAPAVDSAIGRAASPDAPATAPTRGEASVAAVPGAPAAPGVPARVAARAPAGRRQLAINDFDITNIGYDRGDPRAPVVILDFSDFGCPYCGEFSRQTYPVIEREYVRTGKVYFKYMPFIAGFPHGREATRASECAAEQGKFWEMHDRIYETQAEWRRGNAVDAQMAALAGTIPLDSVRYAACYRDRHTEARTAKATALANELGVRVTPSFLVNERPVQGALPIAEFRKVIEAALLLARTPR